MSFLGSIAGPLRKVLAAYASEISVPVLLPCAGNFTVGAALRSGGYKGRITGCDITLYTTALGAYLAGHDLEIREKRTVRSISRAFLTSVIWPTLPPLSASCWTCGRYGRAKTHGTDESLPITGMIGQNSWKKRWPSWKPTRPTLSRVKDLTTWRRTHPNS